MIAILKDFFYCKYTRYYLSFLIIMYFFISTLNYISFYLYILNTSIIASYFSSYFSIRCQKNSFKEFLICSPIGKKGLFNVSYIIGLGLTILATSLIYIANFIQFKLYKTIKINNIEINNYILVLLTFSISLIFSGFTSYILILKNNVFSICYFALLIFVGVFSHRFLFIKNEYIFETKVIFIFIFSIIFYIINYFIAGFIFSNDLKRGDF